MAESSRAADFYVAQDQAGGDDASSCSNAHAMTWFNTAGNWANPKQAGKIGPGDTVHFCGTIGTTATIQNSGLDGNPITLKFESGAKFSKDAWGITSAAAIYGNNKNYITIDGNNVGIIESTNNGTLLDNHQDATGVDIGGNNIIIKNLHINNIFNGNNTDGGVTDGRRVNAVAINFSGGNNVEIYGNTIENGAKTISVGYNAGNSNAKIHDNVITKCTVGITVGSRDVSATMEDVEIYNNTISLGTNWSGFWTVDGVKGWHHQDGVHLFATSVGSTLSNVKVYNNTIGPTHSVHSATGSVGSCVTSWIYASGDQGTTDNILIYNNVLYHDDSHSGATPASAFVYARRANNVKFYNNVISTTVASRGVGVYIDANSSIDSRNNIIQNTSYGLSVLSSAATSDYNIYYNMGTSTAWEIGGVMKNWTQWTTTEGFDTHSYQSDPLLTENHALDSSSPAIDHGTDLSDIIGSSLDKAGAPRSGTWDMGAYEYQSEDTTSPSAPSGLSVS